MEKSHEEMHTAPPWIIWKTNMAAQRSRESQRRRLSRNMSEATAKRKRKKNKRVRLCLRINIEVQTGCCLSADFTQQI